jgi:hypothetical protein
VEFVHPTLDAESWSLLVTVVLVNALVSVRAAQPILEQLQGHPYAWSPASEAAADRMDLVARAGEFGQTPVRVVVGADDHAEAIVAPARELVDALRVADLVEVPGLAHPLADEPGVEAAPTVGPRPAGRRSGKRVVHPPRVLTVVRGRLPTKATARPVDAADASDRARQAAALLFAAHSPASTLRMAHACPGLPL